MKKIIFLFCFYLMACAPSNEPTAAQIIQKSITAYGWDQQEFKTVFDFRDYQYELIRKPGFYSYQRTTTKKGITIQDVMTSQKKLQQLKGQYLWYINILENIINENTQDINHIYKFC